MCCNIIHVIWFHIIFDRIFTINDLQSRTRWYLYCDCYDFSWQFTPLQLCSLLLNTAKLESIHHISCKYIRKAFGLYWIWPCTNRYYHLMCNGCEEVVIKSIIEQFKTIPLNHYFSWTHVMHTKWRSYIAMTYPFWSIISDDVTVNQLLFAYKKFSR